MMTLPNAVLLVGYFVVAAHPTIVRADGVTLTEKSDHVTEAVATIDATPTQIYDVVTDYANWRTVLNDVTSVTVISGGSRDAKVRFKSRALDHEVTIVFDNDVDRSIHFVAVDGPPGARAGGSYVFQPIDDGKRTLVTATLYVNIVGAAGLFIRDSTIRDMRQAKLRTDMTDVARWFSSHRGAKAP